MEASRDQLAENSDDAGTTVAVLTADAGLAAVNAAVASAPGTLAMASYVDAADFAGLVEDLSRTAPTPSRPPQPPAPPGHGPPAGTTAPKP
ncbi:hypothetical protein ACQCSV_02600 [Pseudarthrobacter sp. S3]|uniref:hypothetical protein n=1 Tax=Pseudarthrobacter sp. S3 TaxID=3418419 RepID=UPI003CF943AE